MDAALFAYPYGEWNVGLRALVAELGFTAAFGQHSGAVGAHSDTLNLPRFALNQRYGEFDRFKLIVDTLSLGARDVTPAEQIITAESADGRLHRRAAAGKPQQSRLLRVRRRRRHHRAPGRQPRGGQFRRAVPARPGPAQLHRARWSGALALVRPAVRGALTPGPRQIRSAAACSVGRSPPSTGGCSTTPGRSRGAGSGG